VSPNLIATDGFSCCTITLANIPCIPSADSPNLPPGGERGSRKDEVVDSPSDAVPQSREAALEPEGGVPREETCLRIAVELLIVLVHLLDNTLVFFVGEHDIGRLRLRLGLDAAHRVCWWRWWACVVVSRESLGVV